MKQCLMLLCFLSSGALFSQLRIGETIKDKLAWEFFIQAQETRYHGPVNYQKALILLNKADSIEPNNPIILTERGSFKFDFKVDIDGALEDFQRAIVLTTDKTSLEVRHFNLGITYLSMGDLNKACREWTMSGDQRKRYRHLCMEPFDYKIHNNSDSLLRIVIHNEQDTIYITSSHNSPEMSSGEVHLNFTNNLYPAIVIKDNQLGLSLENQTDDLYLEAIDAQNRKFRFYTEKEVVVYGNEKEIVLLPGQSYSTSVFFTELYHFPNPGNYKIRIAVRPSSTLTGFNNIYYSNWVDLVVVKSYDRKM